MNHTQAPNPHHEDRRDRLLRELIHDPYHAKKKLREPTVCPACGALWHAGRWQWGAAPAGADHALCPACHRALDRCPAGFLSLEGDFLEGHRDEILNLIRHVEQAERAGHPLKRLLAVEEPAPGVLHATFTDPDLARAAGEAVHHAYQGELVFGYQENEFLLRVAWRR